MGVCGWWPCSKHTATKFCCSRCEHSFRSDLRRKVTKLRLLQELGEACARCGYNRTPEALDFHHRNPAEKSFVISWGIGRHMRWDALLAEAKKCDVLCANCHREVENGGRGVSERWVAARDYVAEHGRVAPSALVVTDRRHSRTTELCGHCRRPFTCTARRKRTAKAGIVYCSNACRGRAERRIAWPAAADLASEIRMTSWEAAARRLGVSSAAVRKYLRKHLRSTKRL